MDMARSALIAVDVQNDFCPGTLRGDGAREEPGALAVRDGDAVVAPLNALAGRVFAGGGRVVATQDWHPAKHVSFASSHPGAAPYDVVDGQTLWPDHCVALTRGAAFHPAFNLAPVTLVLRKGFRANLDSYSAFFENDRRTPTGLDGWLKGLSIDTLYIGGLATDYCVLYGALDAARLGYKTFLVEDACRGVGSPPGSIESAMDLMAASGVLFIESRSIV